jgi:hypothetical protein
MGRSNASIRRVQKTRRGVGDGWHRRSAGLTRGQRVRGDEFARFRLETELSEESRIERARGRIPARTRRGRPGTLTPQWWRERRCGRAKGRSEFPAPAGCRPSRTYFAALTQRAAKAHVGERQITNPAHFRRRSNAVHAGGSLNRAVNPGRFLLRQTDFGNQSSTRSMHREDPPPVATLAGLAVQR